MPFQYSAQNSVNPFAGSSHTLSVTVPAGLTNSLMVIIKDCNSTLPWTTFTNLTVNGSTTGVTDIVNSGSGLANRSIRAWYLKTPPSGTYNVAANFSTSSDNGGVLTVLVFDAIDQTTPIADTKFGSGGSVSSPIGHSALTTPAGGFGIFSARAFSGSSLVPSVGTNVGSLGESCVSYLLNGTSTTFSWSGTNPTQASIIAFSLAPGSGGGGGSTLLPKLNRYLRG